MNCLMCSEEQKNIKFIYSGRDLYLEKLNVKFNLKWYECKSCGVYFSDQHPNIEKVYKDSLLYDAAYNDQEVLERYNKIMSLPQSSSDNISRVDRCLNYFDQYKNLLNSRQNQYRVLDIGAGLGVFLARLKDDERFMLNALELNPVAVNHIKHNVGVNTYESYMQDLNFEKKFDLITLNRVLEHISNPIDMMRSVAKAIKNDGLIYIELPDVLSYKLDGNNNEAFSSGHYMIYNPDSIQYLFRKAGISLYNLKRVKEPSGKYTIYAFGGVG